MIDSIETIRSYEHGRVEPGETEHFRFEVSETYVSDPIRLPVTVIDGEEPGPTMFLSAAVHGDELNGVEVVLRAIEEADPGRLHGTIVCLPVVNVPGFNARKREVPLDDGDLNRAFPGSDDGPATERIAHEIYSNFIEPCDFGVDLHTSTHGRSNLVHARGDLDVPDVSRLAHAFATNVILDGKGPSDSLRRAATEAGIPTIVVEIGSANRFQRDLIEEAFEGLQSVFAEFGLYPHEPVRWPGWREIVESDEDEWIRADSGGIVDLRADEGTAVRKGERLCSIRDPFKRTVETVEAPFRGILVGALENPVVYPGSPIYHLVEVSDPASTVLEGLDEGSD